MMESWPDPKHTILIERNVPRDGHDQDERALAAFPSERIKRAKMNKHSQTNDPTQTILIGRSHRDDMSVPRQITPTRPVATKTSQSMRGQRKDPKRTI